MKYCPSCRASYPLDFTSCPKDTTPLQLVTDLPSGLVLRGKYEILEKLGAGGMGAVYKAKHVAFGELRAIKFVSTNLLADDAILARFRSEAVVARKLQHPNAVRVEDLDTTEDGRPFIVMEYVLGRNVRELFYDAGELRLARILDLGRQACRGLGAAHALGIVHRDIKPDNLLVVTEPDGSDLLKIADFGLAKVRAGFDLASGQAATQTGILIGTPPYMSPEQAGGREIDGRSDIYSLGIVLYELVTGRLPFRADTPMAVLMHHLQTPPQPPAELGAPEPLSRFLLKSLAKEPDIRFQTAAEMEDALAVLEAMPLPAYAGDGIAAGFDPDWVGSRRASQVMTRPTPRGEPARQSPGSPPVHAATVALPAEVRTAPPGPVTSQSDANLPLTIALPVERATRAGSSSKLWAGLGVAALLGVAGYVGLAPRPEPAPSAPAPTTLQAAVPAPSAAATVEPPPVVPASAAPPVSVAASTSDDAIRGEIESLLSSSSALRYSRIRVEVRNGIVTLSGSASTATRVALAESLARSATGAREVFNTVRVPEGAAVKVPATSVPAATDPPAPVAPATALPASAPPSSTLGQPPAARPSAAATERTLFGGRGSEGDESVRQQVRTLLGRANKNLESGRTQAAVADFEAVLRLDANNTEARDALEKLRAPASPAGRTLPTPRPD